MTEVPTMRRPRIRLLTMMIVVAASALLIWLAVPRPGPMDLSESLRVAVREGKVELARGLLESGADANVSYENGFTPIYFADRPEVVDLLLARGARLDLRDRASLQSPIEDAAEKWFRDE